MVEFVNKYEIKEDSEIAILTIESYNVRGEESDITVKKRKSYTIIIPIEFIDSVDAMNNVLMLRDLPFRIEQTKMKRRVNGKSTTISCYVVIHTKN